MLIDQAFELGQQILTDRGWDKNEHGDWVRPEDGRPARLTVVPDFLGGDPEYCGQLLVSFAQLVGESGGHAALNRKPETLWSL